MDFQYLLNLEEKGKFNDALELMDQHVYDATPRYQLLRSRLLFQSSDRNGANNLIIELVKKLNDIHSEETKIQIITQRIEYLIEERDYGIIEELITQVLEIVSSSKNSSALQKKISWGKFLLQMGNFHFANSSLVEALDTYLKSIKIFRQIDSRRYVAKVYARLGTTYRVKAEFKKAEKYLQKALDISQLIMNPYDEAYILNRLGMVFLSSSKYDQAESCLNECISYFENHNDLYGLKKAYSNLSIVYRRKGKYPKAIEQLQKGTDIALALHDTFMLFGNQINIGNIYMDNGDLDKALEAFIKAHNYSDKITDKIGLAILESNLGLIYQKRGQFIEALKHYELSMDLYKLINNEKGITKVYHNVGIIYRLQGDMNKALPYFEHSSKLRKQMGDLEGLAWDMQYIGMIQFELAEYTEARTNFEQCYEIRKKIANKVQLSEILFLIISVYVLLGLDNLVEKSFTEMTEIHESIDSNIVNNNYLLSKIKVDQSSRIMKRVLENEVYEEILRKSVINIEHTQEAEIGHCNFLLLDYKSSKDETSLVELRTLIIGLYDKARKQENHQLLVEILVIEAKLSAIQLDLEISSKFLKYAADIAENKNLTKLKLDISLAENEIKNDIEKSKQFTGTTHKYPETEDVEIDDYVDMLRENIEYEYESAVLFAADEKEIIEANLKFAELINKDPELPPETNDALHFLELSLWDYRLLTTTYNLIQRLENNAYYSHPQSFDMHDLLQTRLQVFKQKQVIRKINLIDDQSHDSLELEVDKNLIVVIIDNLLQNAMKFTPEEGIVEIKISKEENELLIEFSNDCRELPDWVVPRLFKRFGQWQFDDQTRKLGIGIGLTFVQSAVKYLGGSVEFVSPIPNETGGALIKIKIPMQI
ncbi:MAG: tetratricopeptide repeat protein [Candidatus Heimdallarchaeota archaeon]|nr:tetratricopeptide repeat protein [Candidatus Heimdallarchaeota archaeon]